MGILDKIGLGKKEKEEKEDKEQKKQPAQQEMTGEPQKRKQPAARKAQGPRQAASHRILVKPLLSEKATMLASGGKYMFEVDLSANKSEIKKSVESVYDVDVAKVHIVTLPGKQRRYGVTAGRTSDRKKAIVTVKQGQKIPGFIEAGM